MRRTLFAMPKVNRSSNKLYPQSWMLLNAAFLWSRPMHAALFEGFHTKRSATVSTGKGPTGEIGEVFRRNPEMDYDNFLQTDWKWP